VAGAPALRLDGRPPQAYPPRLRVEPALDSAAPAIGRSSGPAPGGPVATTEFRYACLDGVVFDVIAPASTSGLSITLDLEVDAAASGNMDADITLTLVDPGDALDGTPPTITVLAASDGSGVSGGADAKDLDSFRAPIHCRKGDPLQGSAAPNHVASVRAVVPTVVNDRLSVGQGVFASRSERSAAMMAPAKSAASDPFSSKVIQPNPGCRNRTSRLPSIRSSGRTACIRAITWIGTSVCVAGTGGFRLDRINARRWMNASSS
jgi:hypothetical protein